MRKLREFDAIAHVILRLFARQTSFTCRPGLAEIFKAHPKLVVAISHATPLSWIPAMALLTVHGSAKGGGERIPMGIMDRFFFSVPVLKEMAQLFSQAEQPLGFSELRDSFINAEHRDLVLFPEGSNCFFGPPDEIQDFRSPRFVELAIRGGAPVLICVHRGSENWAKAVDISEPALEKLGFLPQMIFDFIKPRLEKTGKLSVPVLPTPMQKFSMLCELYDFSEDVGVDRGGDKGADKGGEELSRKFVQAHADRIRARMQEMLSELDATIAAGSIAPELHQ